MIEKEGEKEKAAGGRYTEQFRREAVALLGRPGARLKEIARGLGITAMTLRKWRDRMVGQPDAPAGLTATDLAAENRRLREELLNVTAQRDILKKACGILSEAPTKGTPQ
jgi:transposase